MCLTSGVGQVLHCTYEPLFKSATLLPLYFHVFTVNRGYQNRDFSTIFALILMH